MYLKKIFIVVIIITTITINSIIVYANEEEETILEADIINEINSINASVNLKDELQINSRAAIVYDRKSKEVIWSKNKDEKRKMASTTNMIST